MPGNERDITSRWSRIQFFLHALSGDKQHTLKQVMIAMVGTPPPRRNPNGYDNDEYQNLRTAIDSARKQYELEHGGKFVVDPDRRDADYPQQRVWIYITSPTPA